MQAVTFTSAMMPVAPQASSPEEGAEGGLDFGDFLDQDDTAHLAEADEEEAPPASSDPPADAAADQAPEQPTLELSAPPPFWQITPLVPTDARPQSISVDMTLVDAVPQVLLPRLSDPAASGSDPYVIAPEQQAPSGTEGTAPTDWPAPPATFSALRQPAGSGPPAEPVPAPAMDHAKPPVSDNPAPDQTPASPAAAPGAGSPLPPLAGSPLPPVLASVAVQAGVQRSEVEPADNVPTPDSPADLPDQGMPAYWSLRVAEASAPATAVDRDGPEPSLPDDPDLPTAPAPAAAPNAAVAISPLASALPESLVGAAQGPQSSQAHVHGTNAPAMHDLPQSISSGLATVVSTRPDSPVELRLSPKELGRLRVSLAHEGDALRVTIQVERPETLDLMRRNSDVLMNEIRSAGFSGGTLSFTHWGGSSPGESGPDQSFSTQAESAFPTETLPAPAHIALGSATGGLDLRL